MTLYGFLTVVHIVGAALGVGAAAASDSVFLSSIRNRRISPDQFLLIRAASHVVMGGLTLLVFSGIYLALDDLDRWQQGYFLAKMTVVLVLMLNGFVFHLVLLPFLAEHQHVTLTEERVAPRLWLFAGTGAISGISWFAALLLALVSPAVSYFLLMGIYLVFIVGGAITGRFVLARMLEHPEPGAGLMEPKGAAGEKGTLIVLAVLVLLFVGTFLYVLMQR